MSAVARPVSFWPITQKRLCSCLLGCTRSICSSKVLLLPVLAGQTEGSIEHCERPILRWILSKLTGGVAGHGSVSAYIRSWGQTVSFDNSIVPDGELTIGKSLRAPTSSCRRFELREPITSVGDAHYGLGWGSRLGSCVLHPDRGSEGDSWKASLCKGKAHTS